MKKITDFATLENNGVTKQEKIIIKHYLQELFDLYDIDTIKDIGSIYVLENKMELLDYKSFEMYEPISVDNIEFVDKIFSSFINTQEPLFILVSTDYAIYLLLPETILSAEYKSIFEQAYFMNNKYFDLEE